MTLNVLHFSISVCNFSKPFVTMPIKNNNPNPNFDSISQQPICKLNYLRSMFLKI